MNEVLKWVGTIAAVWVAVSIPAALVIGQFFKRLNNEPPQPTQLRLVSDERHAQQAGEQR